MNDEEKKRENQRRQNPQGNPGAQHQQQQVARERSPQKNAQNQQGTSAENNLDPSVIGPSKQRKKRKRPNCPIHTQYEILFHCHACNLDICKLCWKTAHTGGVGKHHDVVYIEFMKQKEFADKLESFNFDERLKEIDFQSKLCQKSSTHLQALMTKLQQEKEMLRGEAELCDKLISDFGRLQVMARAKDFDHTNEAVLHFMALTDSPYDTREPILSENDKAAIEALIEEIQNMVLDISPDSSAMLSVPEKSVEADKKK